MVDPLPSSRTDRIGISLLEDPNDVDGSEDRIRGQNNTANNV